ncbi:asparagine synthase (glutamine-hydrolyzing), partial [bacterium]|nr:asparagine synthase (glutamine-hydrolyzing) [bacterium]
MCGIAGFSGSFQPELLSVMSRVLAHRGPDAGDHLFLPAQQLGLLHRRLSIIDPSPLGNQPMWDEEGRVCLVYNGEIYNFQELRRELEGEGVVFRSGTDSEVLLQLYRKYGRECLSLLNGMFAFALWDSARGELFLARDELGIKPLYLAHTPKGFLFASEIKALLAEPSLSRAVRPEAVATHIQYLWTPGPHTLFRDVVKLPPGEAVVVSDGEIREQWQYTPSRVAKGEHFVSGEEESETLRDVLSRAVQRQLVADVPLGAFLSGGLDSSLVVALARQHRERHELPCFTIALDEQESRREGMTADLPYARRVAKHLDVPLEELRVGSEVIEHLPMMIAQLDEPVA